ncbi:MAG: PEGA domain-containing protein [Candidatus Dojkabacteria bacterium]|nr:PEGA domain-containing protein [Candidatus Dojkabacteria bacterium]
MACSSCNKNKSLDVSQGIKYLERGTGIVHFNSDPQGATIYIDGRILTNPYTEEIQRTPTAVPLTEGRRNFVFKLQGYKDASGHVDVFANTTVNISRRME